MNKIIFQMITLSFFRQDASRVLKTYAVRTRTVSKQRYPDYRVVLAEIIGDYLFRCPTKLASTLLHDLGIYRYNI